MRIALLPTAWSNVLAGFALSALPEPSRGQWMALLPLLLASGCLYVTGMVMNDICDLQIDRRERPERVLPSGKIPLPHARRLCLALAAAGITAASLAAWLGGTGLPVITALILLGLIGIYNGWCGKTVAGPAVMGLCRSANVLLGCSLAAPIAAGFDGVQLYVAFAIGLYVAGITWLARGEHQTRSPRRFLVTGATLMSAGIVILAALPFANFWTQPLATGTTGLPRMMFAGLLAVLVWPVGRRLWRAIKTGIDTDVRTAVVIGLLTLIMLDASVSWLASPATPAYALGVALLVIPAFLMSRRIMAT
jgi:4-hydroxybenzoate polyprenyltransferase